MKRNLLSSAIIIALMTLGATGCDDNNVKTEATPAASSQPATPAPSQTPETQSDETLSSEARNGNSAPGGEARNASSAGG